LKLIKNTSVVKMDFWKTAKIYRLLKVRNGVIREKTGKRIIMEK
jgi:hypothetical protein